MQYDDRQLGFDWVHLGTGPDIIFFWVARMIMAGYEYRGEKPFLLSYDVFYPESFEEAYDDGGVYLKYGSVEDRKSTRLNSSHSGESRMPSSA